MPLHVTWLDLAVRLVCALIAGAVIGRGAPDFARRPRLAVAASRLSDDRRPLGFNPKLEAWPRFCFRSLL